MLTKCVVLVLVLNFSDGQVLGGSRLRFPMRAALNFRQRLQNKIQEYRERNTQTICYGMQYASYSAQESYFISGSSLYNEKFHKHTKKIKDWNIN